MEKYFLLWVILVSSFVKQGYLEESLRCGVRSQEPKAARRRPKRIINGKKAHMYSWPWLVNFIDKGDSLQYCSGSVIDRYWILSAAHCFIFYESSKVISLPVSTYIYHVADHRYNVTEPYEYSVEASELFIHPRYKLAEKGRPGDYDISLIKLKSPLNFTDQVTPICLPNESTNFSTGYGCYLAGWGNTVDKEGYHRSLVLRETRLKLVSFEECNSKQSYGGLIPKRFLCAGFRHGKTDGCYGDSGGPLQCARNGTWTIVGIMSWGIGCARPNNYGVYTNVKRLLPFVDAVLKGPNKSMVAYYEKTVQAKKFIKTKVLYELFTNIGYFTDVDLVRNLQLLPSQIKLLKKTTLNDLEFVTNSSNLVSNLTTLVNISAIFVRQANRLNIYDKCKMVSQELKISFTELIKLTNLSRMELLNSENNITEILSEGRKIYFINRHISRLYNFTKTLTTSHSYFSISNPRLKKLFKGYSLNEIQNMDDNVLKKILVKLNITVFTEKLQISTISNFFGVKLATLLNMTVPDILTKTLNISLAVYASTYNILPRQRGIMRHYPISCVTKASKTSLFKVTKVILKI